MRVGVLVLGGRNKSMMLLPPARARVGVTVGVDGGNEVGVRVAVGVNVGVAVLRGVALGMLVVVGAGVFDGNGVRLGVGVGVTGGGINCQSILIRPRPLRLT